MKGPLSAKAIAISVLLVGFTLTGCGSVPKAEPTVQTVEVKVPVAVRCSVDAGPEPTYADTPQALMAAPDLYERVKLILAGRDQREARLAELRAASAGCH